MHRKVYVLLVLLTMSGASSAATDDFDSFMGVGWVWILVLSLYAVIAVILLLASFKAAAESAALATKTSEKMLNQATAPQGLSNVNSRIAVRWSPRPDSGSKAAEVGNRPSSSQAARKKIPLPIR